jgi:hypothetical protein
MVNLRQTGFFLSSGLIALLLFGCGVSDKKIDLAKKRIDAIAATGIGDSLLTTARVYVAQAETMKKIGNGIGAKANYDSAIICIQKAEGMNAEGKAQIKPWLDSLKTSMEQRKAVLTGISLRYADSLLGLVTTAMTSNSLLDAKKYAQELDALIPSMIADKKRGEELKPKIVGTWTGTNKVEGEGASGSEKHQYVFANDGKAVVTDERQSQTNPRFKEDWKFISSGTYEVKGDTVFIDVLREQCVKQTYWDLKDGKWVKTEKPTYDSTVASGKKIQFMDYNYMTVNLKKAK